MRMSMHGVVKKKECNRCHIKPNPTFTITWHAKWNISNFSNLSIKSVWKGRGKSWKVIDQPSVHLIQADQSDFYWQFSQFANT